MFKAQIDRSSGIGKSSTIGRFGNIRFRGSLKEEFESRIMPEPNTGCWLWIGKIDKDGYGGMSYNLVYDRAHRWSYQIYTGPILDDLYILHHCDTRSCVNPDHLYQGTPKNNSNDRVRRNRGAIGEAHGGSKLDSLQIKVIRSLQSSGIEQKEIAKYFNVTPALINLIIKNKLWKNLI